MGKLLTVVIPAYNVEKYIERCLDSFINEELLRLIEILVVDDGGKDATLTKAKKYEELYGYAIKTIHKENGGHGSVINYGINNAKGKYLKVVDGDDWIDAKSLLKTLKKIVELDADVDVILTDYIKELKYENTQKYISLNKSFIKDKVTKLSENHIQEYDRIEIHSLMYKTQMLKKNKIKMMEKVFYEDTQFVLFPLVNDLKIIYFEQPIYHYFIGRPEQSVSKESREKHLIDQFKVIDSLLKTYKDNDIKNKEENIKKIWDFRIKGTIKFRYYILIKGYKNLKKELEEFDLYLKQKDKQIYDELGEENYYLRSMRKRKYKYMRITNYTMKYENLLKVIRRKYGRTKK